MQDSLSESAQAFGQTMGEEPPMFLVLKLVAGPEGWQEEEGKLSLPAWLSIIALKSRLRICLQPFCGAEYSCCCINILKKILKILNQICYSFFHQFNGKHVRSHCIFNLGIALVIGGL